MRPRKWPGRPPWRPSAASVQWWDSPIDGSPQSHLDAVSSNRGASEKSDMFAAFTYRTGSPTRTSPCRGGSTRNSRARAPSAISAAHAIDLAMYWTGDRITEVVSSLKTFVTERPLAGDHEGLTFTSISDQKGPVTVDDSASFLAHFAGGAEGSSRRPASPPGARTRCASK